MEKLSGLVLDVYDDSDGAVLIELFGTSDVLPELTKHAHALTAEEHDVLPDEAFALVLVDGNVELKKYATIDAGNTAMSVGYFLKTAHKLPLEAQKVAAQNLVAACDTFGLQAPESLRKAAGMASLGKGLLDPSTFKAMATKATKGAKDPARDPATYKALSAKMAAAKQTLLQDSAVKVAMMSKEAIGAMGLLAGGLILPGQIGEARKNLAATKGSGGAVMTPRQVQARRAQMGAF